MSMLLCVICFDRSSCYFLLILPQIPFNISVYFPSCKVENQSDPDSTDSSKRHHSSDPTWSVSSSASIINMITSIVETRWRMIRQSNIYSLDTVTFDYKGWAKSYAYQELIFSKNLYSKISLGICLLTRVIHLSHFIWFVQKKNIHANSILERKRIQMWIRL